MKVRLTFLSGPQRGRRLVLTGDAITIGADRAETGSLSDRSTGDSLAVIEKHDRAFRIKTPHPLGSLTVNGTAVRDAPLQDGDLLRLAGRHTMRFSIVPEPCDACKPMREIVRQSWRAAVHLDAALFHRSLFFVRDLCDCAACDASRKTVLAWTAILGAFVLALALAGASLVRTRVAERHVVALDQRVAVDAASGRDLKQQIETLHRAQAEKARTDMRLGEVAERLVNADRRLQTAIEAARASVAFLVVGYAFYETSSGKPLRLVVDNSGAPLRGPDGTYETAIDAAGPIATSYAMGSGFVIAGRRLVTNHHVAEPWWEDASAEAAIRDGFRPRYTVTRAYFTNVRRAVPLRVAAISNEADIAMMTGAIPVDLRPLTLAAPERRIVTGETVVVLGYPTGFDALLAKTGEPLARTIVERAGHDVLRLANGLASRRLISPLVTMGHVGDVVGQNIVYDAATTHGGSGGPVLDVDGQVIAVNYATLESFSGAQFGIPIRFVRMLLGERP